MASNAEAPEVLEAVRAAAQAWTGSESDYDALLDSVGDARFVLIGEASHGTREFYAVRAEITRRLIERKEFAAVAVEADWPDAYRVNCYVRGVGDDNGANESLRGFQKFPRWMWRNTDVLHFVGWLRGHNAELPQDAAGVGFYGLDLYSLYASVEEVVRYLREVDPEAARRARGRYGCFEQFKPDTQAYGFATAFGGEEPCEEGAVQQLIELQKRAEEYANRDGRLAKDKYFRAEQNARLVKNAEEYYRSMFRGRDQSWNLRDRHMADTLDALAEHLDNTDGTRSKIVVWAHNSHLGDARATESAERGEWNLGQLTRERHEEETFLIGFSTHDGWVRAADDWDEPGLKRLVRPGLAGSYEALFHQVAQVMGSPDFRLDLHAGNEGVQALREPRLQRAIGVVYRPETERWSHYLRAALPEQFDTLLHFDTTHAVEPLDDPEKDAEAHAEEPPETYPSGM